MIHYGAAGGVQINSPGGYPFTRFVYLFNAISYAYFKLYTAKTTIKVCTKIVYSISSITTTTDIYQEQSPTYIAHIIMQIL